MSNDIQTLLNQKVKQYNQISFISKDPICIPHLFKKQQDIEIAGFFAAIFAWGNRTTIINKSRELLDRMDNAPYAFCTQHQPKDLKKLLGFVHRTFNDTDLLYVIEFFKQHYTNQTSLETAFFKHQVTGEKIKNVEMALTHFHEYFFSLEDAPHRTKKHIAHPVSGSTCKRLNMYLRWMIRNDQQGVDFGIWKSIKPAELICPVDVHVARVARSLGMIKRKQTDWLTALELTNYCRTLDSKDPVKYDFALFSLGVIEKFN
ncbi:MAG: TIGR02757 family protein [Bacteroidetes bacterium]|nr:TIGR02757 family protein [Bacteroidota bacterium]